MKEADLLRIALIFMEKSTDGGTVQKEKRKTDSHAAIRSLYGDGRIQKKGV